MRRRKKESPRTCTFETALPPSLPPSLPSSLPPSLPPYHVCPCRSTSASWRTKSHTFKVCAWPQEEDVREGVRE
jgi:hypothetical protein